jgi:hypothetical protein
MLTEVVIGRRRGGAAGSRWGRGGGTRRRRDSARAGPLGLEVAEHGWRDESAGVGGPTYGAAELSACGLRRGRCGDPGGGAARPLRRGKEKKLTSGPLVSKRKGRGARAGLR